MVELTSQLASSQTLVTMKTARADEKVQQARLVESQESVVYSAPATVLVEQVLAVQVLWSEVHPLDGSCAGSSQHEVFSVASQLSIRSTYDAGARCTLSYNFAWLVPTFFTFSFLQEDLIARLEIWQLTCFSVEVFLL
ncbi:hypothetical protein RRG08_007323 [Elysia crispata]|uniref:Uncharacterized protein n=1 Tax=Elysia crispata TaxID=231223 RepID=A0AAE1E345_9GAST|nr:hypothetical protein RRG08_007323 [Elysia crispata]